MSVKTCENNGKNTSENIGKLNLEENIKTLNLLSHLPCSPTKFSKSGASQVLNFQREFLGTSRVTFSGVSEQGGWLN